MPFKDEFKEIQRVIQEFDHKIENMQRRIRRHLLDKKKYPRPYYESLISKIIDYQIKGVRNRVLEVLLDNLKHKASHRATVWKRWFEDDAKGLSREEKYYPLTSDLNNNKKFQG